jgi:membrane protease YdiL (CAAX protease family)
MQKERFFRILVLLLSFGSISALATFFIKKILTLIAIPFLLVILSACVIELARRYGKAVGVEAALTYFIFMLFLAYFEYASSIVLAFAFMTFPFMWEAEFRGKRFGKILSFLGIRGDRFLGDAIIGVAAAVLVDILLIIMAIVVVWFEVEKPGKVMGIVMGLPLYILIFSFTITPVAEEIFFRGFLLRRIGILLSSVLFAMAHFSYGSWIEFLGAFTAGVVFAVIRRRRNSLIAPIFAHATFNFTNIAIIYLFRGIA